MEIEEQNHAPQPKICDTCYRDLMNRMSDGDAVHYVFCQHTGTQATVTLKAGHIALWTSSGPMTMAQAARLSNAMQAGDSTALNATIN